MSVVFLDTVGLLALWDESDQWHAAAADAFQRIGELRFRLVTTTYVLLECGNAAARRPYRDDVYALRDTLAKRHELIAPTDEEVDHAWNAYRGAGPTGAGIVDQVSFVVMRRLGVVQAFTNDKHFVAAGFETLF